MDLLGGYGSDSEDSSSIEDNAVPVSSVKKESIPQNKSSTKESKKGKRLLQLNAILPQAIFERLSRPEEDSDSDSDSPVQQSRRIPKKSSFPSSSSNNHENNFFGSLLDDLKSVAPTTTTKTTPTTLLVSEEKMGMAFQTTSSVKRKKTKAVEVVNIHDTTTTIDDNHQDDDEQTIESSHDNSRMDQKTKIEQSKIRISAAPPINSKSGNDAIHPPTIPLNNDNIQRGNDGVEKRQPAMSKREMEKALRAGNLNLIHQSAHSNLVEMEGAPTAGIGTTTTKEEWEQLKMTHGKVNLRGLVSYDPKAGSDTTVNDLTSKHRSKHQIHQLMASAARLEAQRSSSLPGNASSSGRNTHRTNAKRKYGW